MSNAAVARRTTRSQTRAAALQADQHMMGGGVFEDSGAVSDAVSSSSSSKAKPPMDSQDRASVALLVLLYTLQGVPMGLSSSIPFLIQERSGDFNQQAIFSLVGLPFALKLLWAPIVDGLYVNSLGRRKSWLVPCQLGIGAVMFYASGWVDDTLTNGVDAWPLARLFLVLYTLCATQDIAVDGWALTMLSEAHVDMASVCNSLGQNLGWGLSFISFMTLGDADTCNKYRSYFGYEPSPEPAVTLGGFMYYFGWVYVVVTLAVFAFKRETRSFGPGEQAVTVAESYRRLWRVVQLPAVKSLMLVLLTCRFGFAAVDATSALKLQEFGVSKEFMASISAVLMPIIGFLVPTALGYLRGNGLDSWLAVYPLRLCTCAATILLVAWADAHQDSLHANDAHTGFLSLIVLTSAAAFLASNVMFTSQMQFYCTLSDPTIGGSYMTLLNTVSNLGGQWSNTLMLKLMGLLEGCSAAEQAEDICTKHRASFYVVTVISVAGGVFWYIAMRPRVLALRDLPASDWRTGGPKDAAGGSQRASRQMLGVLVTAILFVFGSIFLK